MFYVDRISDIFVFYFKHWFNFYQNTWGVGILDMCEREITYILHLNFSSCFLSAVLDFTHLSRVINRFWRLIYNSRALGWESADSPLVIGTHQSLLRIFEQRSGKTSFFFARSYVSWLFS